MQLLGYEICKTETQRIKDTRPRVTHDEMYKIKKEWGEELLKDIYTDVFVVGKTIEQVADFHVATPEWVEARIQDYKKLYSPEYRRVKETIWIPSWYDVIHLVPERPYSKDDEAAAREVYAQIRVVGRPIEDVMAEFNYSFEDATRYLEIHSDLQQFEQRKKDKAISMSQSPTPEIAKNIGVILTCLDDLQDFMTTTGVFARIGASLLKPLEIVARGSFTMGETLNQINMMQKTLQAAPLAMKKLALELDLLSAFPKAERKAAREKLLKEYGIDPKVPTKTLKSMKKKIEDAFGTHPKMGKIKTAVDKRMKRGLPTVGEMLEMAQTADNVASVGLSLGAVVGLAEDLLFGIPKGVPVRFADQTISAAEYNAILKLAERVREQPIGFQQAFSSSAKMLESFAYNIATGKYLPIQDTIASTAGAVNEYLNVRCSELKEAVKDTFDIIKSWVVRPKKHTKQSTLDLMKSLGQDPHAPQAWPVPGLGRSNTIEEIQQAFQKQISDVIHHTREKTNKTPTIEFFDYCLFEIAKSTATLCSEDTEAIKITQSTELTIVTRAIDHGCMPPPDSTDEEFQRWHTLLLEQCSARDLEAPTYKMYKDAYTKVYA